MRLKACPFCGGKAHLMQMGFPHWVYCEDCGAKVQGRTDNGIDSMRAWNRRADEKPRHKCGECKYLNMDDKTHAVGYPCGRPDHNWRTRTAHLKYKTTQACKAFEARERGESV